jgi:TPR repeat protein
MRLMYDTGLGVGVGLPQDFTKAAFWLEKSAEQGDPDAQGPLGVLYRSGLGVEQDYTKALYWLRKAAEQGVDGSQLNLGLMYSNGQGCA